MAVFSVGVAFIFLNSMPAFITDDKVAAVMLSDGAHVQVEIHAMIKVHGVARARQALLDGCHNSARSEAPPSADFIIVCVPSWIEHAPHRPWSTDVIMSVTAVLAFRLLAGHRGR